MYSLAIIIPMYNEEKNAAKCIKAIVAELNKFSNEVSLIVVNDGSNDKTECILKSEQKKYGKYLTLVTYSANKGYGKALQEGIKKAAEKKFDYVLFMDSDLTNDPRDIQKFVDLLPQNPDCVKATRYSLGGKMKNVPFKRRIISQLANKLAALMFGLEISDCTNGFRMTKVSKIKNIKFSENSFPIILEELYYLKKKKAKVLETPVILTSRTHTKSHFSYQPLTFYNYGKYAIKALFV